MLQRRAPAGRAAADRLVRHGGRRRAARRWCVDSSRKSPPQKDRRFKLAVIHSEQDKAYLKRRLREGRIKPLHPAPQFNEAVIDRSEHIVGMMGAEPFMRAFEAGADVVLAGRASDTAIFASLPLMLRLPGRAWPGTRRKSSNAARRRWSTARRPTACSRGCVDDHFVVEAPDRSPALHAAKHRLAQPLRERRSVPAHRMLRHARPDDSSHYEAHERARSQGDGQHLHSRPSATRLSSKAPRRPAIRAS